MALEGKIFTIKAMDGKEVEIVLDSDDRWNDGTFAFCVGNLDITVDDDSDAGENVVAAAKANGYEFENDEMVADLIDKVIIDEWDTFAEWQLRWEEAEEVEDEDGSTWLVQYGPFDQRRCGSVDDCDDPWSNEFETEQEAREFFDGIDLAKEWGMLVEADQRRHAGYFKEIVSSEDGIEYLETVDREEYRA